MMVIKQIEMPTTAAYIAGLIDGGGSLNYSVVQRSGRSGASYVPSIGIMHQKQLIDGFFGFDTKAGGGDDYQTGSLRDIVTFLKEVIPHMTTKKQRAIDLLELCDMRLGKRKPGRNLPYSVEFIEKVKAFREGE